jgi:hypothetical protein
MTAPSSGTGKKSASYIFLPAASQRYADLEPCETTITSIFLPVEYSQKEFPLLKSRNFPIVAQGWLSYPLLALQ